jgi:hypothetical protein
MALTAKVREVGEVSIVDFNGKITLGDNTGYLREEVRSLLSQGAKNIVLNMANVGYVRNLMEMTKLCTIFPVFEDEKAAVSSFEASK